MAARVRATETFAVLSRQVLASVAAFRWERGYDVVPDGQQCLMIRGLDEAPSRLVLVQNVAEESRAKVGK